MKADTSSAIKKINRMVGVTRMLFQEGRSVMCLHSMSPGPGPKEQRILSFEICLDNHIIRKMLQDISGSGKNFAYNPVSKTTKSFKENICFDFFK